MKALRWILYVAVCFAAGTGIALALEPPTVGIPAATASSLRDRLARIEELAADGRCSGVEGQLKGAQADVDRLPQRTSDEVVQAIQNRLDEVASAALAQCRQVVAEREAEEQLQETTPEAEPTTPTEPEPQPEPSTPDPGASEGGPDPGTGEGSTPPATEEEPDPGTGGVTIPNGAALRQQLEREARKQEREARKRLREALDRSLDEVMGR